MFFLFCRLERDKIKDEFPQENLGDVTKLLGQKWKALTKEGKQVKHDHSCPLAFSHLAHFSSSTTEIL